MVDATRGSILNFDAGIARVIWDTPAGPSALPDRRQLPPSELAATQQLDRLLQADNVGTALSQALRPAVGSPDVLRPDVFETTLKAARNALQALGAEATGEARQALDGLAKVLDEQADLRAVLDYYRDMLIAG